MNERKRKHKEILAISWVFFGLFALLSLIFHNPSDHPFFTSDPNLPVGNKTGLAGAWLSHYLILLLGRSSYFIAGAMIFWAICLILGRVPERKLAKFSGLVFFFGATAALFALFSRLENKVEQGGLLGYFIASHLERYLGLTGSSILIVFVLLLAFLLTTEFLLSPSLKGLARLLQGLYKGLQAMLAFLSAEGTRLSNALGKIPSRSSEHLARGREAKPATGLDRDSLAKITKFRSRETGEEPWMARATTSQEETMESETTVRKVAIVGKLEKPFPEPSKTSETQAESRPAEAPVKKAVPEGVYRIPTPDLLEIPKQTPRNVDEELKEKSRLLEATLRDFDIEARVVEIEQGPVITRYELLPAPGIKVASIVSLSDDLSLALKAASVRIIAPIPGKGTVGIEVPNSVTETVYLKELLLSPDYRQMRCQLPVTLGKDTSGKPLIADLFEMPHLLIAGTTGSGKTICVNSIIAGLLYALPPEKLRFVMIDPKRVELSVFNPLPHLLAPVVTDIRKAAATLHRVVEEMEKRFRIFATCGVRNIQAFNQRESSSTSADPEIPARLPYIVVVIDELADLMLVAPDKVETAITRLAQLSRAVGIHLVMATQRPSVDVITGLIKANFPARISFKVASKVDSRTVLDMNGADKLLGKGDLLFLRPGEAKPIRGQGTFVTDLEISNIVQFIKENNPSSGETQLEWEKELTELPSPRVNLEKDELYDDAVRVICETRQASVSVLQRRLRLGYGRAARILDMMEQEGIVGPPQGTKPREILMGKAAETHG